MAILGGLLGAGGSIGGGFLSQPETTPFNALPLFLPQASAAGGVSSLNFGALSGLADPSTLQVAGPLSRAFENFRSQGFEAGAGRSGTERVAARINIANMAFNVVRGARANGFSDRRPHGRGSTFSAEEASSMNAEEILVRTGNEDLAQWVKTTIVPSSGFSSIDDLFNAELDFQSSIPEQTQAAQRIAEVNRQLSETSALGQLGVLQNLPSTDIESLKAQELTRLTRELDERSLDAARFANQAGFNPGRILGDIEDQRVDADLTALSRAIGLISGEQQVAGQGLSILQAGDPNRFTLPLAPGQTQALNPLATGAAQSQGLVTNPLGAGVAQGFNTLGSSVANIPVLQALLEKNAPAT
jgi:hypothetical protein